MKIKLNKKDTVLVHDDKGHVKRVPKSKVPELLKRQGWGLAEEVLPGEGEGWHAKKKTNVTSAPKRKPVPGRQVYRPKGPVNTSHLSLAHYEPEGDVLDEGSLNRLSQAELRQKHSEHKDGMDRADSDYYDSYDSDEHAQTKYKRHKQAVKAIEKHAKKRFGGLGDSDKKKFGNSGKGLGTKPGILRRAVGKIFSEYTPEGDMIDEGQLKNSLIDHGDNIRNAARRHPDKSEQRKMVKIADHLESGNLGQAHRHTAYLGKEAYASIPKHTREFMRAEANRGAALSNKIKEETEMINEVSILHRAPKKKIKVDVSTLRQRARSLAGKVEKALEDYDEVTQDEIDYAGRQAHPRKIAILKNLTAVKAEERAWLNGLVFALKKGSFDVAARTYRNLSPDVKKILPPEVEQFLGQEGLGGVYEGTEVDLEGLLIEAKRTATARKAIKKVLSSKKDNTPPKKINEIEFNPTVDLGVKPGTAKQPTGFRTEATLTEGAKKAWNPKDALYSFAKRPKSAGKPWGFNPITGKKKKKSK